MKQRFVLLASVFVSVVILVIAAGVARAVSTDSKTISATQVVEREAAYNELLAQANQQIQTLNEQVIQLQGGTTASTSSITPRQAFDVAIQEAGVEETLRNLPELVDYEGQEVYEVKLSDGPVYVDSKTGMVVYNGILPRITEKEAGEIAGKFLGGMDPRWAEIRTDVLNGTPIYKVIFDGYVVHVDIYGNVIKAQVYVNATTGGGGNPAPQGGGGSQGDDHGDDDGDDDHGEQEDKGDD